MKANPKVELCAGAVKKNKNNKIFTYVIMHVYNYTFIIRRPQILFEIVFALLFSKLHRYRSGNFHELDENKKETENKSGKLMIGK